MDGLDSYQNGFTPRNSEIEVRLTSLQFILICIRIFSLL